jgi:hypothetical protein
MTASPCMSCDTRDDLTLFRSGATVCNSCIDEYGYQPCEDCGIVEPANFLHQGRCDHCTCGHDHAAACTGCTQAADGGDTIDERWDTASCTCDATLDPSQFAYTDELLYQGA